MRAQLFFALLSPVMGPCCDGSQPADNHLPLRDTQAVSRWVQEQGSKCLEGVIMLMRGVTCTLAAGCQGPALQSCLEVSWKSAGGGEGGGGEGKAGQRDKLSVC